MGALGCALYAKQIENARVTELNEMLQWAQYTSKQLQCRGVREQCAIMRIYVQQLKTITSPGNRCEEGVFQ